MESLVAACELLVAAWVECSLTRDQTWVSCIWSMESWTTGSLGEVPQRILENFISSFKEMGMKTKKWIVNGKEGVRLAEEL